MSLCYFENSYMKLSAFILVHVLKYDARGLVSFRLTASKSADYTVKTTWRGQNSDRENSSSQTATGDYANIVPHKLIQKHSKRVFSCTYRLALEDEITILNERIQKYGESVLWNGWGCKNTSIRQ